MFTVLSAVELVVPRTELVTCLLILQCQLSGTTYSPYNFWLCSCFPVQNKLNFLENSLKLRSIPVLSDYHTFQPLILGSSHVKDTFSHTLLSSLSV